MKHLIEYINEHSQVNEASESKKVTFDFTDLENAEETLDSLKEKEGVTIEDKKLTIEITSDNIDKLGTVQDILQQYAQTIRKSQKVSSDEQYAQKTKSFEENVGKMNDAIDEIKNPDDNKDDNGED